VVFISVLGHRLGVPLDRPGALVIVGLIAWAGWQVLSDGMRVLLDVSLDANTLTQIREVLASQPGVAVVKSVTERNSGRYRFIEADVELRTHDLDKAHQFSERIEAAFREQVPYVDRVLIRYEPMAKPEERIAVPLDSTDGTLSKHFGTAPYFALVDRRMADGAELRREILLNPYRELPQGRGIKVARWLLDHGVDVLAT